MSTIIDEEYDTIYEEQVSESEQEALETIARAKEWTEALVHHLYETGDTQEIEYALEELCGYLEVELPSSIIKVEKRPGAMQVLASQLTKPLFKS